MLLTTNSHNNHWGGWIISGSKWEEGSWDSSNHEVDAKDWPADIAKEVEDNIDTRTREGAFQWKTLNLILPNLWLGRPDDIGQEYKLLAWSMSGYGGGWKPVIKYGITTITRDVHGWGNESDRFIWTDNSPMVCYQQVPFFDYKWSMKTWWLKESEFPFDRERLQDFKGNTGTQVQLPSS